MYACVSIISLACRRGESGRASSSGPCSFLRSNQWLERSCSCPFNQGVRPLVCHSPHTLSSSEIRTEWRHTVILPLPLLCPTPLGLNLRSPWIWEAGIIRSLEASPACLFVPTDGPRRLEELSTAQLVPEQMFWEGGEQDEWVLTQGLPVGLEPGPHR